MARKSNDSELREVWQGAIAAGDDGMRRMVERVVQQVLEAEMTAFVGADIMSGRANAAATGTATSRAR